MNTLKERTEDILDIYDEEYAQTLAEIRGKVDAISASIQEVKMRLDEIEKAIKERKVTQSPALKR